MGVRPVPPWVRGVWTSRPYGNSAKPLPSPRSDGTRTDPLLWAAPSACAVLVCIFTIARSGIVVCSKLTTQLEFTGPNLGQPARRRFLDEVAPRRCPTRLGLADGSVCPTRLGLADGRVCPTRLGLADGSVCPTRWGLKKRRNLGLALPAAGASRTYHRAFPAATGLSGIFGGIGFAGWRLIPSDSMHRLPSRNPVCLLHYSSKPDYPGPEGPERAGSACRRSGIRTRARLP